LLACERRLSPGRTTGAIRPVDLPLRERRGLEVTSEDVGQQLSALARELVHLKAAD
jgi:hypothetical protein